MTWEGERRTQVEALIAEWKARLGIPQWDIRLSDDKPDPESRANVDRWIPKLSAVVRMRDDAPPEVWPEMIIHELLHILLSPIFDGPIDTVLTEYVPATHQRTIKTDWNTVEEQVIHQLTVAFTGHSVQVWPEMDSSHWSKSFGVQ